MLKVWSVRAAWFFVCLGIPGTVLAFFIMPESKNRSSAEIQEMFVDHVPLRRWRGYKTAVERDMEIRMQLGGQ
jgi:SP family general alpha glucoside:H+ symporter-like MFS transporter